MTVQIDNINVETLLTYAGRVSTPSTTGTTAAGTLSLTAASNCSQVLTGSSAGFSVQLPSALTISTGWRTEIYNQSSQPVSVKDASGTTLVTLGQTSVALGFLQTAGSAAGTWIFYQIFIGSIGGVLSYTQVSSATFSTSSATDVLITGMTATPVAGTYSVWFNAQCQATGSGVSCNFSFYKGAAQVVDSVRGFTSPSGSHIFGISTHSIIQFDGATACNTDVNTGGALTITGRTLTLIRLGT